MKPETRVSLSERPVIDTLMAAGLAVLHWQFLTRWWDPWTGIDVEVRYMMFGFGGNMVAIVAGLAAVGISVGGVGDRGRALRKLYGPELRRNRRALLVLAAMAAVSCLVAFGAQANHASWAPYLFEFAVLWTVLRMVRLTWLIDSLLRLDDHDIADPGRLKPQPLDAGFMERMGASGPAA